VLVNLREVLSSDYKGPKLGFSEVHAIKALLEIEKNSSIGRTRLGSVLALGQGETRTLLRRMKEAGLISIESTGCELTEKGRRDASRIRKLFPWESTIDGSSLKLGELSYAIIARDGSRKVRNGIEQRDAAIKSGASGALTIFYENGRFVVPVDRTDSEAATSSAEPWNTLRLAEPKDGDAIIISGALDEKSAEFGAWSAALTLA
jgi:hypothetical protein